MSTTAQLRCLFYLAVLGFVGSTQATERAARDATQFGECVRASGPGDTIIMTAGTWTDAQLVIDAGGDAKSPLTVRAQQPGGVILSGHSLLQLKAPHVVVQGLLFRDGS